LLSINYDQSPTRRATAILQARKLLRGVTFKTVAGKSGVRTSVFSSSDGDGGTSFDAVKTSNGT
jgi:hypothetical protein